MKKLLFAIFFILIFNTQTIIFADGTAACPEILVTTTGTDGSTTTKSEDIKTYLQEINHNNNGSTIPQSSLNGSDTTVKVNYGFGFQEKNRSDLINQFISKTSITCPPRIGDLQTLFMRMLIILDTTVGLVVLFVLIRASIIRMTSRGNAEAVKKSMAMIVGAITGLFIVLGGYIVLIFIGERLLPKSDCYTYSFTDSARILFLFDQSNISPNVNISDAKYDQAHPVPVASPCN